MQLPKLQKLALGLVFAKDYQYEQIMIQQQDELIQAEKMGSLGVLTTGIAHEINNPRILSRGGSTLPAP